MKSLAGKVFFPILSSSEIISCLFSDGKREEIKSIKREKGSERKVSKYFRRIFNSITRWKVANDSGMEKFYSDIQLASPDSFRKVTSLTFCHQLIETFPRNSFRSNVERFNLYSPNFSLSLTPFIPSIGEINEIGIWLFSDYSIQFPPLLPRHTRLSARSLASIQ